jgi:acyl-CoA thioesterase-2
MPVVATGLAEILDLEQIEVHVFRGRSRATSASRPNAATRTFGGEVAGQALVAAGRTVPADRRVHSLHSYFLRPGDPGSPILYTVDPIRNGRSFTTRRVVAVQHGEPIFHLSASFAVPAEGITHQVPHMSAAAPETLPTAQEAVRDADEGTRAWLTAIAAAFPIELRFPEELPRIANFRGERPEPIQRVWLRSAQPLGEDPLLHVCAATYASDLMLLSSALPPHGLVFGDPTLFLASLDHAVWFHAPFRADDWLFYQQEGFWAGSSRALCRGLLFDQSGTLVATVMQEGLVRVASR